MRVELQWSHVHHEYGCTMVYGQDRGICSACAVAEGVSAAVVNHGSIEGRPSHGQRSPFKLSLAKRKRGMLITSPREEQDLREYRIPCKPLWSHLFQASPGGHFVRDATWIKLGHKNHSTSRWYASKTFVKLCYDFCSLNKVCCWSSGSDDCQWMKISLWRQWWLVVGMCAWTTWFSQRPQRDLLGWGNLPSSWRSERQWTETPNR